ncbi:MAG: D-alanyl-D-alanine carboxypeptidase family protein [Nitrospiraceae bacterium]|jgi:serine-type D-Ala-D-Ala carboxypeptidase (penicillin-binding protein 5/6)
MIGLMQSQSYGPSRTILLVMCLLCISTAWPPIPVKAESDANSSLSRRARHLAGSIQLSQRLPWRRVPAHSILLKELNTGETLYQFQSERRLSPASLTKIMSALVILEHGHLDDEVTVSPKAARAHKMRLRLRTGQIFRLEDLLKAMLIVSANDACLAAIEHVGGDEDRFVNLMNAKATGLGLTNTHFSNACGFDSANHYSTAEDLAKLSEIALQDQVFRSLVREEREIIMPINEHRSYLLRNTNRLLGRVPGVEGVKTGFTSKAGRCLIAKVSQDGSDLLLVILNSKRRWNTATSLINYGLRMAQGRSVIIRSYSP